MDALVRGAKEKAGMRMKKKKCTKADSVENQTNSALPVAPVDTHPDRFAYGAEHELFGQALSRVFARDAESLEKSAALLTACCMISKISFEKFFTNLKKVCKTSSKRLKPKKKKEKKKVSNTSFKRLKLDKKEKTVSNKKQKDEQTSGKAVL